jgi:hypothetical protein
MGCLLVRIVCCAFSLCISHQKWQWGFSDPPKDYQLSSKVHIFYYVPSYTWFDPELPKIF